MLYPRFIQRSVLISCLRSEEEEEEIRNYSLICAQICFLSLKITPDLLSLSSISEDSMEDLKFEKEIYTNLSGIWKYYYNVCNGDEIKEYEVSSLYNAIVQKKFSVKSLVFRVKDNDNKPHSIKSNLHLQFRFREIEDHINLEKEQELEKERQEKERIIRNELCIKRRKVIEDFQKEYESALERLRVTDLNQNVLATVQIIKLNPHVKRKRKVKNVSFNLENNCVLSVHDDLHVSEK